MSREYIGGEHMAVFSILQLYFPNHVDQRNLFVVSELQVILLEGGCCTAELEFELPS